jgi:ribonuclease E
VTESSEDPWVLVRRAVQQMSANNDVMRTDRLKQVMLDLDHGFDEKKVGYSKFSLFVREAANKGLIRLRRGENGQQELLPITGEGEEGGEEQEAASQEAPATTSAPSSRGSRRGDGRRSREPRREPRSPRPEPIEAAAAEAAPAAETAAQAAPESKPVETPPAPEPSPAVTVGDGVGGLAQAYALVQEAVRNLTSSSGSRAVRDGDVKREMLRLAPGFDEETLGFSKFTRFLRQAHDAEVVDLNRASGGNYEVSLPSNGKRLPPPSLAAPDARVTPAAKAPPAPAQPEAKEPEKPASAPAAEAPVAKPAATPQAMPVATPPAAPATPPPAGALRGRRGGRRGMAEGIPPILPGQVIAPVQSGVAPAAPAAAESVAEAAPADQAGGEQEERATKGRSRRGRRGGRGRGRGEAAAEQNVVETAVTADEAIPAPVEAAPAPAAEGTAVVESAVHTEPKRRTRQPRKAKETKPAAEEKAPKQPRQPRQSRQAKPQPAPEPAGFNPDSLGLPRGAAEVEAHLTAYKGVGKKTIEQLVATFGAGELFRALEETPDRVREVLGDRRAKTVLDAWNADRDARTPAPAAEEAPAKPKSRTRRGGRGRSGKKQSTPAE